MNQEQLVKVMPKAIREGMRQLDDVMYEALEELRLRIGRPVLLKIGEEEYGLNAKGICKVQASYKITPSDMIQVLQYMSDFSLYALEDEIRQGFITLEGGHRVGLVGKAVLEKGHIKTLKYISGMNIRIAHEVIGCSQSVMPYLLGREKVFHTLIISPPGCGKTTLLRDIIRSLSDGFSGYGPYTVGVVDERSELAACYQGVAQNNMGQRTDVLDGCPKVEGMRMLLRSMAPEIIAVDEIGKEEDYKALDEILTAGVTLMCTIHGQDIEECLRRPRLGAMLQEGLFERIIILSHRQGPCTVETILDGTRQMRVLR